MELLEDENYIYQNHHQMHKYQQACPHMVAIEEELGIKFWNRLEAEIEISLKRWSGDYQSIALYLYWMDKGMKSLHPSLKESEKFKSLFPDICERVEEDLVGHLAAISPRVQEPNNQTIMVIFARIVDDIGRGMGFWKEIVEVEKNGMTRFMQSFTKDEYRRIFKVWDGLPNFTVSDGFGLDN